MSGLIDLASLDDAALAAISAGGGVPSQAPITEKYTVKNGSSFNPGDVLTYQGRRILMTQAVTGLSGSTPFISASKYVVTGDTGNHYISAERFGVISTGNDADATANTTALQNACDYAEALGGATVALPIGNIHINGGILLGQGVYVTGSGMLSTYLQAAAGSNYDWLIANKVAANSSGKNAMFCGVRDLTLDGRIANQTSGTGYGVYFRTNPLTSIAAGDSFFDPHHLLSNVRAYKTYGDGFRIEGRSALQAMVIFAQQCGGWGFWSSFDTNIGYGETDSCVLGGFHFNNGSVRLGVLKAYLSGNGTAGSAAPGFYFGSNCSSVVGSGLEAQNNAGPGYYLDHCKGVTLVAAAESNWKDPLSAGPGPQGAGFVLDGATNCVITGSSTQGKQNSVLIGNQLNAVQHINGADKNDVRVSHVAISSGITMLSAATSDSLLLNSRLVANGIQVAPVAAAGASMVIAKTVDQTVNNSSTYGDDNDLRVPLAASEVWAFTIRLRLTAGSTASDFKFIWSAPSGTTGNWRPITDTNSTYTGPAGTPTTPTDLTGSGLSVGSGAGDSYFTAQGWLFAGVTPGNAVLRWAQLNATAEDSIVKAGSYIELFKLS